MAQTADKEDTKKKLKAALKLMDGSSTTLDKFESIKTLLEGLNPKVDTALEHCSKGLEALRKLHDGEIVDLVAEHWPEETEKEKKRKKAFLFFWKHWKELKAEVERVQKEWEQGKQHGNGSHVSHSAWGKILSGVKGTFGITTIVAVGAAIVLQTTSVQVTVANVGCDPINLAHVPVPLPGLHLPDSPILPGSEGIVTLPPLSVTVDATAPGTFDITTLGFNVGFQADGINIIADGQSLQGKQTSIDLGEQEQHSVVVTCT